MSFNSQGYTLVEMLVAIAVTSIVLSGTYAAYTFFSAQQQTLLAKTNLDRNALRAIDLMRSDIRMAGFTAYWDPVKKLVVDRIPPNTPIQITGSNADQVTLIYDELDTTGNWVRQSVRYCLKAYGVSNRLLRAKQSCGSDLLNCAQTQTCVDVGEPLLGGVDAFLVEKKSLKTGGIFKDQPQGIQVKLSLVSARKIEGSNYQPKKSLTFLERARNVSLVP